MAYNQKAWEITKRHNGHCNCEGPYCASCHSIYSAAVEALRVDSAPSAVAAYRLGYAEGNKADDPEMDGTDFAHPAYLRGEEHAAKIICKMVNDILDGTASKAGTASNPWQQLRQRLYDIRTLLGIAERAVMSLNVDDLNREQWYKVRNDYAKRLVQEKAK